MIGTPIPEHGVTALATVAAEWFKAARRLTRLAATKAPDQLERERAQLSYSHNVVTDALASAGVRLVLHDGLPYTPHLPAEPVNPEDFDTTEGLRVQETLEPTVVHDGRVVARGRVVLERST